MDERRRDDAADGRKERKKGALHARQFAAVNLAFEFQANEQEEDRISASLIQCSRLRPATSVCHQLK